MIDRVFIRAHRGRRRPDRGVPAGAPRLGRAANAGSRGHPVGAAPGRHPRFPALPDRRGGGGLRPESCLSSQRAGDPHRRGCRPRHRHRALEVWRRRVHHPRVTAESASPQAGARVGAPARAGARRRGVPPPLQKPRGEPAAQSAALFPGPGSRRHPARRRFRSCCTLRAEPAVRYSASSSAFAQVVAASAWLFTPFQNWAKNASQASAMPSLVMTLGLPTRKPAAVPPGV